MIFDTCALFGILVKILRADEGMLTTDNGFFMKGGKVTPVRFAYEGPMILYKYVPFDSGLEIIGGNRIGFSQPSYFNDPFDVPTYPLETSDNSFEGFFESVRGWGKETIWSENTGILSLTRNPLNKLMWSHYADEHHGMVIGFDREAAGFTDLETNFIPAQFGEIRYVSSRPNGPFVMRVEQGMAVGATYHFMSDHYEKTSSVFLHKSIDWAYEEEVRVIKCIRGLEEGELGTKQLPSGNFLTIGHPDRPLHLFAMGEAAISEVYLGARCNDEQRSDVVGLASRQPHPFRLSEIRLDVRGFGLGSRPIEIG